MAHQASKTVQKQTTPLTIGRLMDADFFGGSCLLFLAAYESRVGAVARLANRRKGN
jgi:hypothetical protein